ncbi:MAG TPA: symmetrical bis(5'-nucleosyl)-tetraphosphatase [Burkholderiales bacterium]|jgi:bis(5'-nucleosyl)-tetraphosphatase (symmetrical)|nr:symmetrical bis(5'-nucleosyl)-tetraphosphatase [Burkholderiales bacterium]
MATYAIGDLQGCFDSLQQLLSEIGFNGARDRLWFVGDLVNRGPQSLECLRFVRSLGDRAVTVLGNHDLHLLAVAEGFGRIHASDTLDAILTAPDREELLAWLRARPMLHVEGDAVMVHAGLLPAWDVARARELAAEVEEALRGPRYRALIQHMYGSQPDRWEERLGGHDRLRVIINAMTRLRICTPDGRMELSFTGTLAQVPSGYLPWFLVPGRKSAGATVVCGHWSALGLRIERNLLALDSGCLWGRGLSAVRLEDRKACQVRCPRRAA